MVGLVILRYNYCGDWFIISFILKGMHKTFWYQAERCCRLYIIVKQDFQKAHKKRFEANCNAKVIQIINKFFFNHCFKKFLLQAVFKILVKRYFSLLYPYLINFHPGWGKGRINTVSQAVIFIFGIASPTFTHDNVHCLSGAKIGWSMNGRVKWSRIPAYIFHNINFTARSPNYWINPAQVCVFPDFIIAKTTVAPAIWPFGWISQAGSFRFIAPDKGFTRRWATLQKPQQEEDE